jgi:hypothetical protein
VKSYVILILLAGSSLMQSCEEKRSDTKFYYPIDSLINAQVVYLVESNAKLSKQAAIDGKEENISFIPKDSTAWVHELDVFAELNDINKPTNVGKYRTQRGVKDLTSNLLIYTIKSTEKLPVSYINVYYLNTLSDIRKIEAHVNQESDLLNSSRDLLMEFQNINNKIVLTSYSIHGGQKLLLGDSVTFSVNGMVTLP